MSLLYVKSFDNITIQSTTSNDAMVDRSPKQPKANYIE